MDRDRLMKLYARLYAFNHSKDKSLKQAEKLKQEAYDICMTEGANTDNYSPDGTSGFVSVCSSMQMIYNALLQDFNIAQFHHKYNPNWKLSWNGFHFAETELSEGFFRNTLDKSWDLDKFLEGFSKEFNDVANSESYIDAIYKDLMRKSPWLEEVQMSDKDLFVFLQRDIGKKEADTFVYHNHFNKPYDRLCINIVKYYYETGKFRVVGNEYVDGQMEDMCENELHTSENFRLWHPNGESSI